LRKRGSAKFGPDGGGREMVLGEKGPFLSTIWVKIIFQPERIELSKDERGVYTGLTTYTGERQRGIRQEKTFAFEFVTNFWEESHSKKRGHSM